MSTNSTTQNAEAEDRTTLEAEYEGIPVSTLVVGTVVPFDLFTEIDGSALLYRAAGDHYTREQRDSLLETDMRDLLVRRDDLDLYYHYLGMNMMRLLKGPPGEEPDPGDVHDTSVMVAGRAIEQPASRPAFDMATAVIDNAIDMTTQAGCVLIAISNGTPALRALHAHSMRVCFYGLQLARNFGLECEEELSDLGVGLMLHDLGKVKDEGIELTDPSLLENHPKLGIARLSEASFVGPIARDVIQHHHERVDGRGRYQVEPEKFTIHARIAAVADAFDRRTVNPRGKTTANSFDALRAMIAEEKGAYDPKLLALFVRALSL